MHSSLRSRPHRVLRISLVALGVCTGILPADAQFRAVPGSEYREFHNPVNPVRGEAVVGIALAPSEAAQADPTVRVFVAQPFSGEIRVETATADGRFRGEGTYAGSSKGNEWVTLELKPSGKSEGSPTLRRPVGATLLALSARGSPTGELFVSRWGSDDPSGTENSVRLYVNSRRADMFIRAGSTVTPCAKNNVPQPVRFDTYCDVALRDIPKDGNLTLIRREMMSEQSQKIKIAWR